MDNTETKNDEEENTSCDEGITANETASNDRVDESWKGEKEERNSNSSDGETKPKERTKPRVPSALTVENVKKHEEETHAIDVVELMTKNTPNNKEKGHLSSGNEEEEVSIGSSTKIDEEIDISSSEQNQNPSQSTEGEKDIAGNKEHDHNPSKLETELKIEAEKLLSDAWNQPKRQPIAESPAFREEIRGVKYTGEEYLAISIDVQTDESWIAEMFEWPQVNLDGDMGPFASRPTLAVAAADGSKLNGRRYRNLPTSDLSSSGIDDDKSEMQEPHADSATAESSYDAEDENPVVELADSEFGGSEAYTYTTNHTLPSVGPPFILQYKAETKMAQINYDEVQVTIPEDIKWEDLSPRQREYYENLKREMKQLSQKKKASEHPEKELINIEPHSAYGSKRERKLAQERAAERGRMREMEKQTKQTGGSGSGPMVANQTNFYAFARQLKTVNYSLSSEKCMEEGWTIRPLTPPTPEDKAKEFFVHDPNSDIISGKRFVRNFVQRFYPDGRIFLTVFPDGTGNVWYPSKNVAVSILASEKIGKLIFILHEDVAYEEGPDIQALFKPNGYCTCYYPSGGIRLMLTPFGGEYFSPQGARLKKWSWKDMLTHVHAPPFQPIAFALSRKVGIRVVSQESIYITFTDGRRSVRFNAGTRLKPNPMHVLPKLELVDADRLLLDEKRARIQMIIERITASTMFPNSPRLKKMQLPSYLTSQLERTAKLRAQLLDQQLLDPAEAKRKTKKVLPRGRSLTQSFSAPETNRDVVSEKPKAKTSQTNLRRNQKQFDEKESDMQPVVIVN